MADQSQTNEAPGVKYEADEHTLSVGQEVVEQTTEVSKGKHGPGGLTS